MPFTREQFFEIFRSYNESIWPAQAALTVIAVAIVVFSVKQHTARWNGWLLAGLWAWCAVAFFWAEFSAITAAAWPFGALFAAGAFLLIHDAGPADEVTPARRTIGALLVVYALAIYPSIAYVAGHRYPATPTFGAPCPVTIFTIGILLTTRHPLRIPVVAAPVLWSLIGGTSAFLLGVPEDLGLLAAGVAVTAFAAADFRGSGGSHERYRTIHP